MHKEENTILGHMKVKFNHVYPHIYTVLESLKRILGSVSPISSVSDYKHLLGFWIVQFSNQLFNTIFCKHNKCETQQKNKRNNSLHFHYII